MALVDDRQRIRRQVIEKRRRRLAGLPPGEVPRVILDPVAVADLLDHLEIEHRSLVQSVRLEDLAFSLERAAISLQLRLDALDRPLGLLARRDEVGLGVDRHLVVPPDRLAGQRVERDELVDLVAEQLDAKRGVLIRRTDLDDVAADPEGAARELVIVPFVLDLDELPQDLIAVDPLPTLQRQHHPVIRLGRSEAIDT